MVDILAMIDYRYERGFYDFPGMSKVYNSQQEEKYPPLLK
jgi:hypothetical protein